MTFFRGAAALLTIVSLFAFKGDKPAYLIYNDSSKESSYKKMLDAASKADVVLFGELHNNPISHWLQLQLTKDLHKAKGENLVLGAEMFEADNQLIIDEYLAGNISRKNFEQECRLWPNYDTDYAPLMQYAVENKLHFAATNIPRRYANLVFREGPEALENLPEASKAYMAPLPVEINLELECYQSMLQMMGDHGGENLPKAQAMKDATMAWFIKENRSEGQTLLHFNGAYHSDNWESIVHYLNKYAPGTKVVTITTVLEESPEALTDENRGKADFTIAVAADMTTTH